MEPCKHNFQSTVEPGCGCFIMERVLLSVASEMNPVSVCYRENLEQKNMEIISCLYQNAANSYSGSNLVTIRMW